MCDKVLREIEKTRDKTSQQLKDYCSDNESQITNRKSLRDVRGYVCKKSSLEWPYTLSTWCPRASIYYAYTEDTNPFDRIEEFIENERKNSNNQINQIHFDPPLDPFTIRDPYEENAAREKYLRSEPVSFAIFGKPGLNTEKLAKLIAEWWKCVLVSPKSLVSEEIDKKTDKGQWIEDTLNIGETLGSNVIMNLIESRVKERDIMHRGYVIEGLPFIPDNPEIEYSTCPENNNTEGVDEKCCKIGTCAVDSDATDSSSTTSLSNNEKSISFGSLSSPMLLQRTNIDMIARADLLRRTTIQETLRQFEKIAPIHTRVNPFKNEISTNVMNEKYDDYIPKQIEMIFNTWPLKPTVIIYVSCPDEDAIENRENFSFDPYEGKTVDTRFYETMESQFDDERLEQSLLERVSDNANVKLRCEIYKRYALPVIERHVLRHNPQNVIRVEGRTTVTQMFETVSAKLRCLPLSRAIIPKRIWRNVETFEGEGDEEFETSKDVNFDDTINEKVFEELSGIFTISSKFRWTMSNWKFTCPVESTKGHMIEGKAEYSVRFMNKIFFLSSTESMNLFLANPRPFLSSMKPRPSCRMAIFGPRYSGKSELCEALGRNFREKIVDVRQLIKEMINERIDANVARAVREARHRVIEHLRMRLENERKIRENARIDALSNWLNVATEIIREHDKFQQKNLSEDEEHSEPRDFTIYRKKLCDYGLEMFEENYELMERARDNETIINDYAPDNLRNEEPPIRELSEHDPEVAAILENEVKHLRNDKIMISKSEIAGSLISRIKMMPDERIDDELSREPGCIVDGMYPDPEIWTILIEAGVTFNDLILITDESPYESLLLNWKRYYETKNESGENDYEGEYIENTDKIRDMEKYIEDIKDFEEKWENFRTIHEEENIHPFICKFDETSRMYGNVSKLMTDRYRLEARVMTDEEREREFEDSIGSITEDDKEDEEELENEENEESTSKTIERDDRRLGDTGIYCPVALSRNILWKGKNEHGASFLDKVYLCSSAEALENFVKNPEAYGIPFEKPMTKIPLARICIVGTPGSGKTTMAKILSTEYAMTHVDFTNNFDEYIRDRGIIPAGSNEEDRLEGIDLPSDLTDKKYSDDRDTILAFIQKYKKEGAALPKKMLDKCLLNFFKQSHYISPIIFDSFPNCLEDAQIAVDNYALPELVIELECSLEKVQERLLPKLFEAFLKSREIDENNEEEEEDTYDVDEVRERLLRVIEETYEKKNEMIDKARTRLKEESIKWIIVNADKDVDALLMNLRKIVNPFLHRESSIFERTYQVDPYKADNLLECGYYLLSSFGRSCPVQMYERENPFQMYLPMDERNEIYPILHRHYVYFIAGEEASKMFMKDPLKYIEQDSCDPVIQARISIIGPPKSGKTTLAERFARTYGMRVIEREEALRWIRKTYNWTKTAVEIEELSRSGDEITSTLLARAVQLYSSDYRSTTQGYILDGFPDNREETEELTMLNIRPMIVVKLQADRNFCLTSSLANDEKIIKSAKHTISLISQRYDKWQEVSSIYLDWLEKFSQNIVTIDATASKWAVWRQADRQIRSKFNDIKRYFREIDYDKVHSLKNLSVSPYEFKNRQSPYESYCPACLHYDETMRFSGSPPDRRGVVQFHEYFYWICSKHLHEFTKNPLACLPPQSAASLPTIRPQILNDEIDIEHACWAKRLVADGNCIVTYADTLPESVILPGKRNIGIIYEDKLYLFCSLDCREKFLQRAPMYSKIVIKLSEATTIAMRNLTNIDYLERTVSEDIIKSVTEVAAKRPKYPGISPAISAAIYIGIYLKIHNIHCAVDEIKIYEEVHRRVNAPRRVPVPDTRFDYLCEYFKPASKVPAFLNVVDIAGLVKGAAAGQGLGNDFLSHISSCDAIFHLCRAFEDDDVTHIEGDVNPIRDLEIINEELRLKDIEFLGKQLERLEKLVVRGNDKKLKPEYDTLFKVKNILHEEEKHVRFADWSVNEIEILNKNLFLTSKPVIYLVNLSEKDYIRKKNKWLIKIKEWVDKNDPGASLIPFSGAFENKVIDMDEAEAAKYFEESKVTSALDKIIVQGYKALQLQYFFTSGADEVKAWTIQKGTKAPQAAGRIHTDFEKGFIMAEVMKFDDFKTEGSESGVKAAGKYRQQGRNYVVDDGDIIFFKFNAGAGLKDAKKK